MWGRRSKAAPQPGWRLANWGDWTSDVALVAAVRLDAPATPDGRTLGGLLRHDVRFAAYSAAQGETARLFAWLNGIPPPGAPSGRRAVAPASPPLPGLHAWVLDEWRQSGPDAHDLALGLEALAVAERAHAGSAEAWELREAAAELRHRLAAVGALAAQPAFYMLRRWTPPRGDPWERSTTTSS